MVFVLHFCRRSVDSSEHGQRELARLRVLRRDFSGCELHAVVVAGDSAACNCEEIEERSGFEHGGFASGGLFWV